MITTRRMVLAVTLLAPGVDLLAQEVPHALTTVASAERRSPDASRWRLRLRIDIPRGLHIYAEDGSGYEAVSLKLDPAAGVKGTPGSWPVPSDLLFAMAQPVKVYEGVLETFIDLELSSSRARALRSGRDQTVTGTLHYQSCTEDACFRPRDLKLSWKLSARAAASPRRASSRRH